LKKKINIIEPYISLPQILVKIFLKNYLYLFDYKGRKTKLLVMIYVCPYKKLGEKNKNVILSDI